MKPSKNAILGYTYQEMIAFLLLVKMDVEREIDQMEIETDVSHNFDDAKIITSTSRIHCQMKDYADIRLTDLRIKGDNLCIKGNNHKLSEDINILFIKEMNLTHNSKILGFPAYKLDSIYVISITREEAWEVVMSLYENNENRIAKLKKFFDASLDKRELLIKRNELPAIEIYSTELLDKTIKLQELTLNDSNVIIIEGKPGVGKSHLVNQLNLDSKKILYRFWVSNQDKNYRDRLNYVNFISNLTKELFQDYLQRTEEEIFGKLHSDNIILVLDGLDHVENYSVADMQSFIGFINNVGLNSKVIIFSRPLKVQTHWETKTLSDWNRSQTEKFLNEQYHISEYEVVDNIFRISNGYPILVSFLAKHYKGYDELPDIENVVDIADYYNSMTKEVNTKSALTLFLTSRSYFMWSEIENLMEKELYEIVRDFISSYPYLFEIRLNRISLIHDSFNTYLKNLGINYDCRRDIVHNKVYTSIMMMEKRYLSRFNYFDLSNEMKLEIVKKYSDIHAFNLLMTDCIDFEAIQAFYDQVRQVIGELEFDSLSLIKYFDLSLICNITGRDHISSVNSFLYTYVKSLLSNGYSEEDITSSDYLFSILYYVLKGEIDLLVNVHNNNYYSTENFYSNLLSDIKYEEGYFDSHKKPVTLTKRIEGSLNSKSEIEVQEVISYIMTNLYLFDTTEPTFMEMYKAIVSFVDQAQEDTAVSIIEKELMKHGVRKFFACSLLRKTKDYIESLGQIRGTNDYHRLALEEYIEAYANRGSFDLMKRIQNYLRLSNKENRKIDISKISKFWTMYHERKDYSVISINVALKAFEAKGLISEIESCKLIAKTQKLSEKGISHIFNEYIKIHDISIIEKLDQNFVLEDLEIRWLDLPADYINFYSKSILSVALKQLMGYHSVSRKLSISDVKNGLVSNKAGEILRILSFCGYVIEIPENHHLLEVLKQHKANFVTVPENKKDDGYKSTSLERFNQGVLTSADIDFIREIDLKNYEVAAFNDGYYAQLADLDIFSIFSKENMQEEINRIIYCAFLGKLKSINTYGNLYYFVGNVPQMFLLYDIDVDWKEIYHSFILFLKISLIDIN